MIPLWILLILVCAVAGAWGYAWQVRCRYARHLADDHFIEDLLKRCFEREEAEVTLHEACVWSGWSEERVRKSLLLAQYRGWVQRHEIDSYRLTPAGRLYGAYIKRAHRLYELHLAHNTGYPLHEWHERAERMEHTLSPDEVEALARRLGDPLFGPSGKPIPTPVGDLPQQQERLQEPRSVSMEGLLPLTQLPKGVRATIMVVGDEIMGERRRRLSDLGFVRGGEVSIYLHSTFGQPTAYLVRDTAIALRRDQAQHIWVRPLSPHS